MPRMGDAAGLGWQAGADRRGAGYSGGGVRGAGGVLRVWVMLMLVGQWKTSVKVGFPEQRIRLMCRCYVGSTFEGGSWRRRFETIESGYMPPMPLGSACPLCP